MKTRWVGSVIGVWMLGMVLLFNNCEKPHRNLHKKAERIDSLITQKNLSSYKLDSLKRVQKKLAKKFIKNLDPEKIETKNLSPAARLFFTAGKYDSAISVLERIQNKSLVEYRLLFEAYWYNEHISDAEQLFRTILEQKDSDRIVQYYYFLFRGYKKIRDYERALSILNEAIERFDSETALNFVLERAEYLWSLGQKGQARSYLLAMKKYYTETRALGRIQALLNLFNLVGEKAPELVVDNWVGIDSLSLEQLRGHVVLLDFWAPWCGPCRTMLPFLKNLYERYYDKGLEIIGVTRYYGFFNQMGKNIKNLKPSQELKWIKKFRTRYQVPYPYAVASMTSGQLNSLAYGVSGIPHTILIDRNGHVRMYSIGFDESKKSKIATGVMELINH